MVPNPRHINSYRKYEARRVELNADLASSLKKSILQYAIQGKLVPQDLNDEPASVLLERICEDKQGLVKEGKIKKSKKETRIYNRGGKWYEYDGKTELELEVPFEIPGSWIWVRLKTICDKITDGTHRSPPNGPNGEYMYISAKNIKDSGIDLSNVTYVSETVHREIYSRCDPKIGDILFIKDGATTGTVTINTLEDQFSLLSSVALIRTSSLINPNYVISIMKSPLFYREVRNQMDGGAITRVTLQKIESFLLPLPPINEQSVIVSSLLSLSNLVRKLDDADNDK